MKPDTLPPTVPLLEIPLTFQPDTTPTLTAHMSFRAPDWHKIAAYALLAVYVAAIGYSALAVHRRFHPQTIPTVHPSK
jgi:hypothetical protein